MIKTFENMTYMDIFRRPLFYNHLIKSTANRFLHEFLSRVRLREIILDIGSGKESVVPSQYQRYSIDIQKLSCPSIVADAANIPVKTNFAAHICCSWMYEHIEEPQKTLLEFYRVLKSGGYLYLTANFTWHLHESPRDFFRFTRYGIRYLFNTYGKWDVFLLKPTAGLWLTLSQLLSYKLAKILPRIHPVITLPLQLIALYLEKHDFDETLAAGYAVIARKR